MISANCSVSTLTCCSDAAVEARCCEWRGKSWAWPVCALAARSTNLVLAVPGRFHPQVDDLAVKRPGPQLVAEPVARQQFLPPRAAPYLCHVSRPVS